MSTLDQISNNISHFLSFIQPFTQPQRNDNFDGYFGSAGNPTLPDQSFFPSVNAQMPGIPGPKLPPIPIPIPGIPGGQPPKPRLPGVDQPGQDLINQIKKQKEEEVQQQIQKQMQIPQQIKPTTPVTKPPNIPHEYNLSSSAGIFGDPVVGKDYPWFSKKIRRPSLGAESVGYQPRQVMFIDGLPYDIFTFQPIPPEELGNLSEGMNKNHVMSVPSLHLENGVFVDGSGKPFSTANNGAPLLSTAIGYVPWQSHTPSEQEAKEQRDLGNKFYK
jgi:hypothetical protein